MENLFYGYVDNCFEIELSRECVENCCHSGDCEEDCQRWIEILEIKKQFDKIPKERLINHILEYGCHEKTELQKWNKKDYPFGYCGLYVVIYTIVKNLTKKINI